MECFSTTELSARDRDLAFAIRQGPVRRPRAVSSDITFGVRGSRPAALGSGACVEFAEKFHCRDSKADQYPKLERIAGLA